MDKILREDIDSFRLPEDLARLLRGSTVIVTGSTGLVGGMFVRCVDAAVADVKWVLPVRDAAKAEKIFCREKDQTRGKFIIIAADLADFFTNTDIKADYIVHCASPTNGRYMSGHPAETFLLAVESTRAALDYCRRAGVKGMVYCASIEYYGERHDDLPVSEETTGHIDHQSPRSSYALGKQAAEYLCFSYAREYGVAAVSARLTQTFGAGISPGDTRVFAQFARSALQGENIELHTAGLSAKPYCYTTDTVSALIYILLKGTPGEAYNVATPGTYVSIREFAALFRDTLNPSIEVTTKPTDAGYAPETRVNLNPDRLLSLGWRPVYSLPEMIRRLAASMKARSGQNY